MNNSDTNKQILARNLNAFLRINNIDRNKLCADLDISYSTLADWLNAKKYPRIDKIERLANYFGVQKSDIIEDNSITVDLPLSYGSQVRTTARYVNGSSAAVPGSSDDWVPMSELEEIRERLHKSPGMRTLFSLTKDATPEDLELIEAMLKRMKKDSGFDGPED